MVIVVCEIWLRGMNYRIVKDISEEPIIVPKDEKIKEKEYVQKYEVWESEDKRRWRLILENKNPELILDQLCQILKPRIKLTE